MVHVVSVRGAALTLRCSSYARSAGVAGRLVFPAPPSMIPLPGHPRGLPLAARSLGSRRNRSMRTSHLRPTSELSPFALADSTAFSPGFVHTARYRNTGRCASSPLHRHLDPASTPAPTRGSSLRPRGCHPRSLVPSSWFLTTSTASSAVSSAGLLHPAANPGVHRVVTRGAGPYPSKNSSPTAAPRHRGRCPLAVPTGFEALLRRRVWCRRPPLPADDDPLLPGLRSPSRFTSMRPEIHLPPPSPRRAAPRRDALRRGCSVVAPGICFATEVASTGHPRRRSGVGVNRAR